MSSHTVKCSAKCHFQSVVSVLCWRYDSKGTFHPINGKGLFFLLHIVLFWFEFVFLSQIMTPVNPDGTDLVVSSFSLK